MEKGNGKKNNFIRIIALGLGLVIGTLIIHDVKSQDLDNSLLWEIKGNGIKTSYLYGTVHILSQDDFELKQKVRDAFSSSDQVVLEMDMDNPSLQKEVMEHMRMKDGMTLDKLFSEEEYSLVNDRITAAVGMGLENFNTFKPFFLTSILITTLIEGQPASFEGSFVQLAEEQDKEVVGLETPAYQAEIFDQISYEEQAEDVLDLVNNRDRNIELFQKMIEFYNVEDLMGLYKLIEKELNGENEFELLIKQRNKSWVPKLGNLASEKSSFFAVGAGHLGGESGMINLLRRKGYEISPVE